MVGTRAEAIPATEDSGQLELMSLPTWLDVHDWDVTVETSLPRQATSLIRLKW
jgi:xylan 1,4-beta-xylosidase